MAKIILIKTTRYIRVPKLLFDLLGAEVDETIIEAKPGAVTICYTTAPPHQHIPTDIIARKAEQKEVKRR